MKKVILLAALALSLGAIAQPCGGNNGNNQGTGNNGNGYGNNPCNPVPLDDYLPILMVLGGGIGAYFYWKKTKSELKTEE